MADNTQPTKKFKPLAAPSRARTLDLAVEYVAKHFGTRYLFPIKPGAKFPPLIKNNLEAASNDPDQLREWEEKWKGCNWGVAHRKSKLMVADVDTNKAKGKIGQQTFDGLDLAYGWPETETTITPSGGFHRIYEGWADDSHPAHVMALGENGIGKDIDAPNYTLIAGCTLDDGTAYVGNDAEAVRCPEWIYTTIKSSKTKSRITDAGEIVVELDQPANVALAIDFLQNDAEPSIQGQGGDFNLLKAAYYLKDIGISQQLGAELLNEHFNPRCEPPWDMADFVSKMTGAYSYANLSKVGGKTAEADFDGDPAPDIKPMGMWDPEKKVYTLDAKKIKRERGVREKARKVEAARPKEVGARKYTRTQLSERWVYLRGIERFVCRDDPPSRKPGDDWDPDVNERPIYSAAKFDKAFMSLAPKSKKISDVLLREKKGGIAHFENMVYRPGKPELAGENYNIYRPSTIKPAEAVTAQAKSDLAFWNAHLAYLFPDQASRDHVLNFIAWRIQFPDKKMKHALILQGRMKGTGKSFIGRMLAEILGANNVSYPREQDLANKFNVWAMNAQFIIIEELRAVDKRKIKANLHPMITEEVIPIELKGVDIKKFKNCFGLLAMTNEDAALSIDSGDRRYLVVRTDAIPRDKPAYGPGFDPDYYVRLFGLLERPDSIAAIGWDLLNRDLKGYSAASSAPDTDAKVDMIEAGGEPLTQWLMENAGEWPLCARLTTVEEVVAIVPRRFKDKYVDQNVAEALKAAFKGVRVRIPVNGTKKSLWAINADIEVSAALRERDKAILAEGPLGAKVASRTAWLAQTYEADRIKAGRNQPLGNAFEDDDE